MTRNRSIIFAFLEIAIILVFIFIFTRQLQTEFAAETIPPGEEYSYLINSGALASFTFQQNGAIPLWNPLIGHGEPLFENLFSYLFNPFMTYPILFWGIVQGGKIAIMLHIVIMALGGWALGRALKLDHGGAVLLALLLAASGSFNSALDRGFYQIGLSLAYVPWVYAGVIGLLYRPQTRRWLGILVVATVLLIFVGSFWYVVPTAIGCALIALFALRRETPALRGERIRHLLIAGALIFGFGCLVLIPRLNSYLVYHPPAGLGGDTWDLSAILQSFFVNEKTTAADWWFAYHFIIPGWFALVVVIARLILVRLKPLFVRWRILIPAFILILFFCVWAQGNTPLFNLLYDNTFLNQWRWPIRMAAAAAPFVALIAAVWFDETISLLAERHIILKLGAAALVLVGLYGASQVYWNWDNLFHFEPYLDNAEYDSLTKLRADHPDTFLAVQTEGPLSHLIAHALLIRSSIGNPDVFTNGLPSPPNFEGMLLSSPQFAVASNENYANFLHDRGFVPYPDSPTDDSGRPLLWLNPQAVPYAFVVQRETLAKHNGPVTPDIIDPVAGIEHHLDHIDFTLGAYKFNSILIVQEADYPGWSATVDGQPATIELFDGYLALSLPLNAQTVEFEYHAPLLVVGTLVYCLTLLLFGGYLLRADDRIKDRLKGTRFDPSPRLLLLANRLRTLVESSESDIALPEVVLPDAALPEPPAAQPIDQQAEPPVAEASTAKTDSNSPAPLDSLDDDEEMEDLESEND